MTRLLLQLQDTDNVKVFHPLAIVSIDRMGCFHFETVGDGYRSPELSAVHACYLLGQAAMGWTDKLGTGTTTATGHEPYILQNAGEMTGCKHCHLDRKYWERVTVCPGR